MRFPLFSAVCTFWMNPNEGAVTFVGGGAKFGWFSRFVNVALSRGTEEFALHRSIN